MLLNPLNTRFELLQIANFNLLFIIFQAKYQGFYGSITMYRHVPFFSNLFHNEILEILMGVGVLEAQK